MGEVAFTDIAGIICAAISAVSAISVAIITRGNSRRQKANHNEITDQLDDTLREIKSSNKLAVANGRSLIAQIYEHNKASKTIETGVWESVSDLYDAYKSTKIDGHTPNSWCDEMVAEMRKWRKI